MIIRDATLADVAEISNFLQELTEIGKRTRPSDPVFVQENYVESPNKVKCSVAEDADGSLLGLQSLQFATSDNIWGVEPGWGIIGTHIRPSAARRGVGRALYTITRKAARDAGLAMIDASIGAENVEGLGYYDAMGFKTYRTAEGRICKCFDVASAGD